MKKSLKILLSIIGILAIGLVIINFPLTKSTSWKLDNSILLEYHQFGGIGGSMIIIKIFKNSSVEFNEGRDRLTKVLSNEDIQRLKSFIGSKEYSVEKTSLSAKWIEPTCCDLMSTSYLINEDGETIMISYDKRVSDIIQPIEKEAFSKLYNLTK